MTAWPQNFNRYLLYSTARSLLVCLDASILLLLWCLSWAPVGIAEEIHIRPGNEPPQSAIRRAKPGDSILIHPGKYAGGHSIKNVSGTKEKPITIRAANVKDIPVISGGAAGWQFSGCSHINIQYIIFDGQYDNGLNIDDDNAYLKGNLFSATGIKIENVVIRNLKGLDNNDGIKLSGIRDFTLSDCRIDQWGVYGAGIDMVACIDGQITRIRLDGMNRGGWGIQAKGGSRNITIKDSLVVNATQRGIQIGGITSPGSMREKNLEWEAEHIDVIGCSVFGADASIAFVNSLNSRARHCRFIRPHKWFFRVLIENKAPGFGKCRNTEIQECLCVGGATKFAGPIDSGPGTELRSIRFQGNIWYDEAVPAWDMRLGLPSKDENGISGLQPTTPFLRQDTIFSEARYQQLRNLLAEETVERTQKAQIDLWIFLIGLTTLWLLLLISHRLQGSNDREGSRLRSRLVGIGRFWTNPSKAWLSLMLSIPIATLLFFPLLYALLFGVSKQVDSLSLVPEDRIDDLLRIGRTATVVVLSGVVSFVWFGKRAHSAVYCCTLGVFVGFLAAMVDLLVAHLNGHSRLLEFGLIVFSCVVGFITGVVLYGFSRNINARLHRFHRSVATLGYSSKISITVAGCMLFYQVFKTPLTITPEFLMERWRSLAINWIPNSRLFDIKSTTNILLYAIPLGWAIAGLSRKKSNRYYCILKAMSLILFFVIVFAAFDLGRARYYLQLDQVLVAGVISFGTYLIAPWVGGSISIIKDSSSSKFRYRSFLCSLAILSVLVSMLFFLKTRG